MFQPCLMILSLGPSCWAWWSQFLVEDVLKTPISLLKTRSQRIWPFFSAKCWDGPMTFHSDKWIVVHSHSYHSWPYLWRLQPHVQNVLVRCRGHAFWSFNTEFENCQSIDVLSCYLRIFHCYLEFPRCSFWGFTGLQQRSQQSKDPLLLRGAPQW